MSTAAVAGPDWETKVWGRTRMKSKGHCCSVHELEVFAGGYCSLHYHQHRNNVFNVVSGRVRIVWCFGWDLRSIELGPGQAWQIASRIPHQFQVLVSGGVEEFYSVSLGDPDYDPTDIVRLSAGGLIDPERMQDINGIIRTDGSIWTGQ